MALGLEIGRQPCGDGVITAEHAGAQRTAEYRSLEVRAFEDIGESGGFSARIARTACGEINLGIADVATNVENPQRRQDTDPEARAPGGIFRQQREERPIEDRR